MILFFSRSWVISSADSCHGGQLSFSLHAVKTNDFCDFCRNFLLKNFKININQNNQEFNNITFKLNRFQKNITANNIDIVKAATEIYNDINKFISTTTIQQSDAAKSHTIDTFQSSFRTTAKEKLNAVAKQQLSFSAFDLLSSNEKQNFADAISSLQDIKSKLSRANSNPDIQITSALDQFVKQVASFNHERDKIINNNDFPYVPGSKSERMSLSSYTYNLKELQKKLSKLNTAIIENKDNFNNRETNEPPYELQAKIARLEGLVKNKPNQAQPSAQKPTSSRTR